MKTNFTPGPWIVRDRGHPYTPEIWDGTVGIARIIDRNECIANARLIAAAPEMLDALMALVCAEFGRLDHPQINDSGLWRNAGNAIAKAKGTP